MITKNNYFEHIKRIGFDNLPLPLKKSHLVILVKTDKGKDWSIYERDEEVKKMIDLAFKKLTELIAQRAEGLSGQDESVLSGYPPKKEFKEEIKFIKRFLSLHHSSKTKAEILEFIEKLQEAILNKKIRKSSAFASEIKLIQDKLLQTHKHMKGSIDIRLKEETITRLQKALELFKKKSIALKPRKKNKVVKPIKKKDVKEAPLSGVEDQPEPASENTPGKVMNSNEFAKLKFDTIGFKEKWLGLIGDPCKGFSAMVYGKPKMGKSYLCIDFAGYLARNHGKVLYVAKEEKLDATLQQKLKDKDVAHENLFVSDDLPEDLSVYDFIFLDSVNKMGLLPKDLEELRAKNPGKAFIFIFQTTKDGNFRGANAFQHDVDIVIEIPERGRAVQFGRFNQGGEMQIFPEANAAQDNLPVQEQASMLAGITDKNKMKKKETKFPAWTMPKYLDEADHSSLKHIYTLYKAGKLSEAYEYACYNCDTVIRDEIPGDIWKKMGGQLTPAGEAKLKARKGKMETPEIIEVKEKKSSIVFNGGIRILKSVIEREWDRELTDGDYIEILDIAQNKNSDFPQLVDDIHNSLTEFLMVMHEAVKEWDQTKNSVEKTKSKFDKEFYANRKDAENPAYIFSLTSTKLLVEALRGDFDLIYLVRLELANRGQDSKGEWVGFKKADEIHRIKR